MGLRLAYTLVPYGRFWPALVGWVLCALIFAAPTSVAVWRLRRPPGGRLGAVGGAALALSGAWAVVLPLDQGLAYQLGLVGAGFGPVVPLWGIVGISLALAVLGTALLAWPARRTGEEGGGASGVMGGTLARDAALTLFLTGLAPALVVGVIGVGCELTYCGA